MHGVVQSTLCVVACVRSLFLWGGRERGVNVMSETLCFENPV